MRYSLFSRIAKINGISVYIFVFFLVWSIRATLLYPIDEQIASPEWRRIYADFLRICIWIIPVLVYLRRVDRTNPAAFLQLNTLGNKREVLRTGLLVMAYFGTGILLDYLFAGENRQISFIPLTSTWLVSLLFFTIVPLSEEILYRGFFLGKIGMHTTPWRANLVTSFLFAAVHWPFWLYSGTLLLEIGMVSVRIFILSLLLGYLAQKTETLWPSIVTHAVNNLISAVIIYV